MITTQVAILGGGLAGLNAARLLQRAGVDFHLFEARDRLGGRILTVDAAGLPDAEGFDLGPSWFWPDMQPAIGALVGELGLDSFAQHGEGAVVFERTAQGPAQRYPGLRQEPPSMRLTGGTGALIGAIAAGLPAHRLHTACPVTQLTLEADSIMLTARAGDGQVIDVKAAQVIAALPPRLLERTVAFAPDLPGGLRRLWRTTPTWMAPHAKFLALYDRPFWREAGLSGTAQSMAGPMGEIHDATGADGRAALFGFLGVSAAQRARVDADALTRACVAQLARLFGPEAARPEATLYKDWAADPCTATELDLEPSGHPVPAASWVDDRWCDRLTLAGSEVSAVDPGYLAGAAAASVRAVDEVRRRLA